MKREEEKIKHESFGQLSFSRITTSGNIGFYGSELKKGDFIQMELSESEIDRTLSTDWFHASKRLVKVRMTANQFSQLITSLNNGSGIPCTIEQVGDKFYEDFPVIENRKEFTSRMFRERMLQFSKTLSAKRKRANELIAKKNLSKNDQEELNNLLNWIMTETTNNIPYFSDCFQDNIDKVVLEAKIEIEAAVDSKIYSAGLGAIKNDSTNLLGK
jgi:hypothetical protein